MIGNLKYFCDFEGCNYQKKIMKTPEDFVKNHAHVQKYKTFAELRQELQKDDHTLKEAKVNPLEEQIHTMIDRETDNLIKTFTVVINNLKEQMKNFVSFHIVSVKDLFELFTSVIQQNDAKIEELQHLIPKLSISKKEMMKQEDQGKSLLKKFAQVFKELNDKVQAMTKFEFKSPVEYKWSSIHKSTETQINGTTVSSSMTGNLNMNLLEPSFTMADVTKVKLKVTKLSHLMLQLCDVNIKKYRKPTWDGSTLFGDGTYSHQNNGGIYPHHLAPNQSWGQVLAFPFQEGDILDLEWNGPTKQFITSRPSTNSKFVQNVQFNDNALLHFGVQIFSQAVEIIQ